MSTDEAKTAPNDFRFIAALAGRLGDPNFPTGDHAALRRMDPRAPGRAAIALHKLMADVGLDEAGEKAKRWALVIHCLALARGAHDKDKRTGAILHDLPLTELRLNQLLAADQDVLFDLLPSLARRLAAQGAAINWAPLAMLALYGDHDSSDRHRLDIARAYARAANSKEKA